MQHSARTLRRGCCVAAAAARFRRAGLQNKRRGFIRSFIKKKKKRITRGKSYPRCFWQHVSRRGGAGGTGARLPAQREAAPTAGAAAEARSCRYCFHRVHRISRGAVEVNAPGKLMGVMESTPRLFYSCTSPPPFSVCPYRTVQCHVSLRRGGPGLFACAGSRSPFTGLPGRVGREGSGKGTARRNASDSWIKPLSQPGLSPRCITSPRPSPARLPQEGGGAVSCGAGRWARGSPLSPPARPTHAHGDGAAVPGLAMANGRAPAA